MPHGLRRVPISTEVNSFYAQVSSDDRLMACGNLQHGAVIADTGNDIFVSRRPPADSFHYGFFIERHDRTQYIRTLGILTEVTTKR